MKPLRKATGTGPGCALLMLAGLSVLIPVLWILVPVFLLLGLYYGSKAVKVYQCTVCGVQIERG